MKHSSKFLPPMIVLFATSLFALVWASVTNATSIAILALAALAIQNTVLLLGIKRLPEGCDLHDGPHGSSKTLPLQLSSNSLGSPEQGHLDANGRDLDKPILDHLIRLEERLDVLGNSIDRAHAGDTPATPATHHLADEPHSRLQNSLREESRTLRDNLVQTLEGVLNQRVEMLEATIALTTSSRDGRLIDGITDQLHASEVAVARLTRAVGRLGADIQVGLQDLAYSHEQAMHAATSHAKDMHVALADLKALTEETLTRVIDERWSLETQRSVYLSAVDAIVATNSALAEGHASATSAFDETNRRMLEDRELVTSLIRDRTDSIADEVAALATSISGVTGAITKVTDKSKSGIITAVRAPNHRALSDFVNENRAFQSLISRYDLKSTPPPLTPSAMTASTLEALVNLVECAAPRVVLECGSGVSTVWLAYALSSTKGRLISLDHLDRFAEQTRDEVSRHDLTDAVEIRTAPLEDFLIDGVAYPWYGRAAWADLNSIDLLIVDGPPTGVGELARYPALPLLVERLADQALVIADDIGRRDESTMVKKWLAAYPQLSVDQFLTDRTTLLRWSTSLSR